MARQPLPVTSSGEIGADQAMGLCTTLRRPLVRVWPRGPSIGKVRRLHDLPSECGSQLGPSSRSQELEDSQVLFGPPSQALTPYFSGFLWCRRISHDADRSPLPERRGNNARQPTNDREQA